MFEILRRFIKFQVVFFVFGNCKLVSASRGANIQTVTSDFDPQNWTDTILQARLERGESARENLQTMRDELLNMYNQTKVAQATLGALHARMPKDSRLPPGSYGEQLL